jgi:hypothetical protein
MAPDHHRGIGVAEHRCTGQQVISGRRQAVLVGAAVDTGRGQLLGRGVIHRPDRHVRLGQTVGLSGVAGNPEVGQHNSASSAFGIGQQDVRGFDVAVQ